MNEQMKALSFYRRMQDALRTTGVDAVILTMDKDGEMQADAVYPPVNMNDLLVQIASIWEP